MKQILTLYPNPYDNDTMAKLVIDGLEHTKNVNVVEHDYSKAIYTKWISCTKSKLGEFKKRSIGE